MSCWDLTHCTDVSISADGTTAAREAPGTGWAVLSAAPAGTTLHRTRINNWGLGQCALGLAPPSPAVDLAKWPFAISWSNTTEKWAEQYYGIRRGAIILDHDLVNGSIKATFFDDTNQECGGVALSGIPPDYRIVCQIEDCWNCQIVSSEYS